ncbi:hypothetical protein D0B54_13595 [Solimonas sp. K1W22B-7]|uniref:hypothetical protein n=1 Tax=Solimonas sp. K1W22B-7 TaxID=2303331 RepID=UPI000E32E139|nr:hypothetical protein [Solimonas sp. K1W22B-7]AXQ29650.1 hypothetical protein D0B54_13595 [Solimonas sp. K1W22B-7]
MIWYLVTAPHAYTVSEHLRGDWGAALRKRMVVMPYELLTRMPVMPQGSYIFSDLERLDALPRKILGRVWARLQDSGCRMLNHPERSLRRLELLDALHKDGRNDFRAFRADTAGEPWRYPVFLRQEKEHSGAQSPLLHDLQSVREALLQLVLAGHALSDLLVVEMCDTADADGIYRKYSAFRIGEHIVPRHVLFSRNWMLKDMDLVGPARRAEILDYCQNNPHESELRGIFSRAQIGYGRIDYALDRDGRIQVWEINTNPQIMRAPSAYPESVRHFHQAFAGRYLEAMQAIDSDGEESTDARWSDLARALVSKGGRRSQP